MGQHVFLFTSKRRKSKVVQAWGESLIHFRQVPTPAPIIVAEEMSYFNHLKQQNQAPLWKWE